LIPFWHYTYLVQLKTLGNPLRRNPRLIVKDFPERLAERLIEFNGVYAQVSEKLLKQFKTTKY